MDTEIRLPYIVDIVVAGDLATQEAKVSAAVVSTFLAIKPLV